MAIITTHFPNTKRYVYEPLPVWDGEPLPLPDPMIDGNASNYDLLEPEPNITSITRDIARSG